MFQNISLLQSISLLQIWAEMTIDKASEKSIRLTALDANAEVKVFLIMVSEIIIEVLVFMSKYFLLLRQV